jgi:cupin 2 domain-containing protein
MKLGSPSCRKMKKDSEAHEQVEEQPIDLKPHDHVTIPAHRRHRVEWTTSKEPTVWLAVFFRD